MLAHIPTAGNINNQFKFIHMRTRTHTCAHSQGMLPLLLNWRIANDKLLPSNSSPWTIIYRPLRFTLKIQRLLIFHVLLLQILLDFFLDHTLTSTPPPTSPFLLKPTNCDFLGNCIYFALVLSLFFLSLLFLLYSFFISSFCCLFFLNIFSL